MTNFDRIFFLSLLYIVWLLVTSCGGGDIAPVAVLTYTCGDGQEREMDVYVDDVNTDSVRPSILYFHGGSWISGSRAKIHQRYREHALRLLLKKGFVVFSVDYRLVGFGRGHLEGAVADCKDALAFVVENSQKYGVDTTQIGLWGSSAGAHLAMMSAFADSTAARRVKYLIDDFGPVDICEIFKDVPEWGREWISDIFFDISPKSLSQFDSLTAVFSPINYDSEIPVLIFHGEDDDVVNVRQSRMLHDKLSKNSIFTTFSGNGHGLKNLDEKQLETYLGTFENFVDEHVK